jgi:hypothetical protein
VAFGVVAAVGEFVDDVDRDGGRDVAQVGDVIS